MEKMSVAIMASERAYAGALARGLAEESSGLALSFCITDTADEKKAVQLAQALAAEGKIVLCDRELGDAAVCARTEPLAQIFARLRERFFAMSGRRFCRLAAGNEKLIGLFSSAGGCGCTAAAITLARWLALVGAGEVLYLSAALRDDHRYYLPPEMNEAAWPGKKELLLRVAEGIAWEPFFFCRRDSFGVNYLRPEPGRNTCLERSRLEELLAALTGAQTFFFIVIDGLEEGEEYLCDLAVYIEREGDKRCGAESPGQRRILRLPCDEESFSVTGREARTLEISMEGRFAAALRPLAEELV